MDRSPDSSRRHSVSSPDVTQHADALSNIAAPIATSRPAYSLSHTVNTNIPFDNTTRHGRFLHTPRGGLSSRQRSFLPHHHSLLSAMEVQYPRQRRSPQYDIPPVLPSRNFATLLADGGPSTLAADPAASSIWEHRRAEPLEGITTTMSTRAGDQNASPVVRYPFTFPNLFCDIITEVRHNPPCFVTTPSATTHGDLGNEMSPEASEYVKHMADACKEDAKGVLMFSGIFSTIVASFIIESYKMLSPSFGDLSSAAPTASIVCVNILWLTSLVLGMTCALFATMTLQWARGLGYIQTPEEPRDRARFRSLLFPRVLKYGVHHAVAMTVLLLHFSVFLFLVGLVIFFFTIHKTVAGVVSITVGLFGVLYLILTIVACLDHNFPYRTPLSGAWWSWWSQREQLGYT